MKKVILAWCAMGSVTMGATIGPINTEDSTLKAYWDFTKSSTPVGSISWSELPTWNAKGYGESTATDKHPYTTSAGLSAATGFTVSFDINQTGNGTLLSMTTGNMSKPWRSLSITMSNDSTTGKSTVSAQFLGIPENAVSKTLTLSSTDWTTLTLVGYESATVENTLCLDFYVNGDLVGTSTNASATNFVDETINNMQFGYFGNSGNGASTNFDNILVYSRALNAAEVKNLTVPEPTVATLSLLALAGLAARRRRK